MKVKIKGGYMNRIRAVIAIICVCSSLLSIDDISAKDEQPVPMFHKIIHKTPQLQAKKKYKIGYINGTNIYIRTKPTTKSKHLSRMLIYGNKVKYKKVNSKWSSVKSKKMHFKGYIMTKYISKSLKKGTTYTNIPSYKLWSYMDYRCITNTSSKQYKLQRRAYTGNYGIRQVKGRYCIAVGSYYTTKIGTKIDLVLNNGTVVPCILADCKANKHTDRYNQKTPDGSLVEFVVNTSSLTRMARRMGDISYSNSKWRSKIKKIVIYK